jgi:hypothetical protein
LATGLLSGIAAAVVMAIGLSIFFFAVSPDPKRDALSVILATSVWTALGASILALFPIGPIAALLGWLLYRNGVVSRLAYAAAGAFAGTAAPVFLLLISIESMRHPTTNYVVVSESGGPFILAGFAIAGAFGGFMAGRVIQRKVVRT